MNLQTHARLLLCATVLGAACLIQTPALADAASDAAKVERLLKQSGYAYEKKRDDVWVVVQHGDNLPDFKVVLATGDGLLVTFVTFARKSQMDLNPDFLTKLLRLNSDLDRIKILIDDDGDAAVRIDASIRVLDADELKEIIHQVAASSDEVYGKIKPDLH